MVPKTVDSRALNKISRDVGIFAGTFGTKSAVARPISLILDRVLNLEQRNDREFT
jgi:hypothetical protein